MKKARVVEFPSDRALTFEEYEDLKKHAYNSALWYVTNYAKNSYQIRTKLYDKGYPKNEVETVDNYDEKFYSNIVEEVVKQLEDFSYVDDESYIDDAISSGLRKGKSISSIKTKLIHTGLPKDMIEKGLEGFEDDKEELEDDALDRAAQKIVNSYSFTKIEDKFKAKQKVVQSLGTKGFPMGKIFEWIDNNLDLDLD